MGARLGMLGGLLFSVGVGALEMVATFALHKEAELRDAMIEKLQEAAAANGAQMQPVIDYIKTPDGFLAMLAAALACFLVASVVLGGIGGFIGSSIFRRRDQN